MRFQSIANEAIHDFAVIQGCFLGIAVEIISVILRIGCLCGIPYGVFISDPGLTHGSSCGFTDCFFEVAGCAAVEKVHNGSRGFIQIDKRNVLQFHKKCVFICFFFIGEDRRRAAFRIAFRGDFIRKHFGQMILRSHKTIKTLIGKSPNTVVQKTFLGNRVEVIRYILFRCEIYGNICRRFFIVEEGNIIITLGILIYRDGNRLLFRIINDADNTVICSVFLAEAVCVRIGSAIIFIKSENFFAVVFDLGDTQFIAACVCGIQIKLKFITLAVTADENLIALNGFDLCRGIFHHINFKFTMAIEKDRGRIQNIVHSCFIAEFILENKANFVFRGGVDRHTDKLIGQFHRAIDTAEGEDVIHAFLRAVNSTSVYQGITVFIHNIEIYIFEIVKALLLHHKIYCVLRQCICCGIACDGNRCRGKTIELIRLRRSPQGGITVSTCIIDRLDVQIIIAVHS